MIAVARILLRRVALLVPLLLGIVLFVFLVMRFSDVDPASAFFQGANPTPRQLHQFRQAQRPARPAARALRALRRRPAARRHGHQRAHPDR